MVTMNDTVGVGVIGEAYSYTGPESYHSFIGQAMSSLGYMGGHDAAMAVRARVSLQLGERSLHLVCSFGPLHKEWHAETDLQRSPVEKEEIKHCLLRWHSEYTGICLGPWGLLTGVRPTKLVHHLLDQSLTDRQVQRELVQRYQVEEKMAAYLVKLACHQRPYVTGQEKSAALYIGIPYCPSHCLYCSFPSRLIGQENQQELQQFAQAVIAEIDSIGDLCRRLGLHIDSIYVGGGTPTCLPYDILESILRRLYQVIGPVAEYTVEAGRPDTADEAMLCMLRRYGVDRISVNPQTMQQSLLDRLGRQHRVEDIYDMYDRCRKLGFAVVNMDFIAGLPGQTALNMQENMEIVCQLRPENVTIHTLALKKRAPLFHHALRQEIPSPEVVASMLDICSQALAENGYSPYYMYRQKYMAASFANTGYTLDGYTGKYNIQMMEERQTVFAVGPGGANKFIARPGGTFEKLYMPKEIDAYIKAVQEKIRQRQLLCSAVYEGEDI